MTKGLGTIMAEVAMEREKERIEKGESVACPLCGREMEYSVAWFCYGEGSEGEKCPELPRLAELFFDNNLGKYYADDFQGQVVAAVIVNGQPVIDLITVRGPFGRTNLRVSTLEARVDKEDVPGLIQEHGWTWMDWASEYERKKYE